MQQNFLQRIMSTIQGLSIPLLYLMASCFPRHFYAQATHDPIAILGSAPISCYTNATNPHGFASTLSIARNLGTHSSSSTSTCPITWSFLYDVQANKVAGGIDSRLISRNGFIVDVKSKNGISTRAKDQSALMESVDSHQAALDLAATQPYVGFDWFLTFTCNQAEHPGISHLHAHKESMKWTKHIPEYDTMSLSSKLDVKRSFELAYGSTLGRCWMEVRKLFLEYITFSTTSILGELAPVMFRDEFQEHSGNLSHIHGLAGLKKEDMDNDELRNHIYSLQKCAVCDLFPTAEIDDYIAKGLFDREGDWVTMTARGKEVLSHKHSERCLRRVSVGKGKDDYVCRKIHSVFGKDDPLKHELKPLYFKFSPACLDILQRCGLWDPPTENAPNGTFRSDLLVPKRHLGPVHPGARCNMSPVIDQFFAATKSMQNAQILHGTNGVARYVVKYIVKLDDGNRCIVWADAHTGAVMRAEKDFLHNTKITSSKANENKAYEKSRKWRHPSGRAIAFTEMQQQLLGYPEVMTTLRYVRICTKPFEHRSTTKVKLNENGDLIRPDNASVSDTHASRSPSQTVREMMGFLPNRFMTPSQLLLYRNDGVKSTAYDEVTQFSLRPVELLELFPKVGKYFRWFHICKKVLKPEEIMDLLDEDIERCGWVDGLGRRILLRKMALKEVNTYLENISEENVQIHSWLLRNYLIRMIEINNNDGILEEKFVHDDLGEVLPIPVFSSVTPHNPVPFLLHMMLMLGEFETELDLRMQGSMRESLAKAKLIGNEFNDDEMLKEYSNQLVRLVVTDVLSVQPVSLRRIDDYVILAKQLFDAVLSNNDIPIAELPPCILTEMLDSKDDELKAFWEGKKNDQLTSIYQSMPNGIDIPEQEIVASCSKLQPVNWDPVASFTHFDQQSEESFIEQRLAITIVSRSILKYSQQFGPDASTYTKGDIIHGAPGSGKTFVIQYLTLFAISQGLRVMTTALMAVRANAIGGIHLHRLFGLTPKKSGNPYRLAELALDKLHRNSQLCYLHVILTMDVLVIDECGQLSAQQLSILDLILRIARNSHIPFGGVLILGTMDHTQLGAIDGWPFLLSSHILTDFVLIRLSHSVRAHGDAEYQEIQALTRMNPVELLSDPAYEIRFKKLLRENMTFVDDWDDPKITPDVQRMYARRMPAYEASSKYVESCQRGFEINGTPFTVSEAED